MLKLKKPKSNETAVQCRQMGIVVGDTIIGRETYSTGSWSESKMQLLFSGKEKCVFKVMARTNLSPRWKSAGESANWTLRHREWFKVTPTVN